jgi:hypothetical protein
MSGISLRINKEYSILQIKTKTWETTPADLEKYRLIFILTGNGHFVLDRNMFPYKQNGFIGLKPGERCIFQEDPETEILQISFDKPQDAASQQKKVIMSRFPETYKKAEKLCNNLLLSPGQNLRHERDDETIRFLIQQISFEMAQKATSHIKMITGSIEMILTILTRNNFPIRKTKDKESEQTLADSIVAYLCQELQQKKNIRIAELLDRFGVSEELANLCVLNKTGMSLRSFIVKSKTDLFKSRMTKMDLTQGNYLN